MSQVLSTFGLLDFTMLWPVHAGSAFLNLWTIYFFNFPNFLGAAVNCRYGGPPVLPKSRQGVPINIWLQPLH
jgi:hypothetical protein